MAYHPSAADRRAVLDEPARHAGVTFVDGLTAAFLAAVSFPLLKALVSTVTAGVSFGLSAAIVGPLLGATVGLGLWRQALVRRITGDPCSVAPAALGVLVGYGFGEAASLASTGLDSMTEYDRAALGALTALAASGATVVAAGLGELFADASARFPTGRAAWFSCVLLVAPLFAIGLWAATTLAAGFDWGGWSLASTLLVTILGTQTPAFVALLLAAASAWALLAARSGGTAPTWAVEAGEPPSWPTPDKPRLLGAIVVGIAAGTIGALVLACFRLLAGSGQPEQRYYLSLWLFAAVGAATGLALVAAHPARGLGVALLASPVASGTAAAGYVALNTALGGSTTLSFVEGLVTPGVALGLLLLLVVAVVSLAPRPQRRGPAGTLAAVAAGSVLAGGISLGVVAARDALVPVSAATEGSATGRGPQASSTAPAKSKSPEAKAYATVYAPAVERRMAAIERSCGLSGEATSSTTTESKLRLRVECLGPANSLLDEASGVRPSTTAVRAVHDQLLAALRSRLRTYELLASPHKTDDLGYISMLRHDVAIAEGEWWAWQEAVARLSTGDEVGVHPTQEPTTGPPWPTEVAPTPSAGNLYAQRTCGSFQRMVAGIDTLSHAEQQALLNEMADSVAQSGDPELMRAVADLGQGVLAGEPSRFAAGMRSLSALCGVPYQ